MAGAEQLETFDLKDNDQRHGAAKLVNIAQPLWMDLKFRPGCAYGGDGILISLSRCERLTPHASSFIFNLVEASCSGRDIYSRLPGLVGANHFARATCRIQDIRQQ